MKDMWNRVGELALEQLNYANSLWTIFFLKNIYKDGPQ